MKAYRILWMLLAAVWLARLATLGAYDLLDPTEGRYAEIARLMVAGGDWITPRLAPEEPFWGKPPLSFWTTAVVYRVLGISDFTSRLPSWLVCTLMLALTYVAARRLQDTLFGVLCVLVLASTGSFFVLAGGVMTDPALALCVTLSVVALLMAQTSASSAAARRWWYGCFAGIGLSMLAKGPVGVALTAVPLGLGVLLPGRSGSSRRWPIPVAGGLLLAGLIALPWYVMAEWRTPGFMRYFFIGEHMQRFLTPEWSGDLYGNPHVQPRGMIWLFMLASLLPWSGVAAAALVRRRAHVYEMLRDAPRWFWVVLAWGLAPALVFTCSRNIMWTYVLPGLPGMAMAISYMLHRLWHMYDRPGLSETVPIRRLQWLALCVPLLFVCVAVPALRIIDDSRSQKELVTFFLKRSEGDAPRLMYFRDKVPYSARFYSGGRALSIAFDRSSEGLLAAQIADDHSDFYAIRSRDIARLPGAIRQALVQVSTFGKYVLFADRMPGKHT